MKTFDHVSFLIITFHFERIMRLMRIAVFRMMLEVLSKVLADFSA